jgi:hypothetical protein
VGGERVPFPIRAANTKFELSEGETYLLNGNLVVIGGLTYLQVDFSSQPWLATSKVKAFPYFEIDSIDPDLLLKYQGRMIQMAVITKREKFADLKLSLILPPVLWQ